MQKCVLCHGSGHLPDKFMKKIPDLKRIAIELRKRGLALREIQKVLNQNNPQTILNWVGKREIEKVP